MLLEYALVPNIFRIDAYSSDELAEARLQSLKPMLLEEALVRNIRAGEWWHYIQTWIKDSPPSLHPKAKELLKQLKTQKRLREVGALGIGSTKPESAEHWLLEALISHAAEPLSGIIALPELAQQNVYKNNPTVVGINRLTTADWMERRDKSRMIQIPKQTIDYCQHLRLILSCANSVMFIDPYLDPSQSQYGEFYHLLNLVKQPYARIELHSAVKGQDQSNIYRSTLDLQDWIQRFSMLSPILKILKAKNSVVKVFIWQDFDPDDQKIHDRYILTDLVGISMTSGLNTQAKAEVTWSRQTKKIYEKTQKDFHPNAGTYRLKYNFMIPKE